MTFNKETAVTWVGAEISMKYLKQVIYPDNIQVFIYI